MDSRQLQYGKYTFNFYIGIGVMVTLAFSLQPAAGANILMIHPIVSRSHEIVFVTLGEALANRGHSVTLVRFTNPFAIKTRLVKSVFLDMKNGGRHIPYMMEDGSVEPAHDLLWSSTFDLRDVPWDIVEPIKLGCETLLNNSTLELLFPRGPNHRAYDVVIVDIITNECALALAHHYGIPVIAYWASFAYGGELFWTNAPAPPSIVPALTSMFTDKMTFFQRLKNTMYYIGVRIFAQVVMLSPPHAVISKVFPNAPHPTELVQNISMLFVNSDFALDFPRPTHPNTVYIGCVQCFPPKPLPQQLEDFMQSSGEHGVIVFSMGATFREDVVPKTTIDSIFQALGRLKQNVLLKMGEIKGIKPPANVWMLPWLPQQDIMGHTKTRLFITHCGMHGVMEAIYHGVPMVGIPIFADQGDVLARMVDKGVAVKLQKWDITPDNLYNAIMTVISNQSYAVNAKKISRILHDQPQSPMERAIFWTEYVIRHDGADHLKGADRYLNLIQYCLLDVVAFILFFLFIVTCIIMRGVQHIRSGCSRTKVPSKSYLKKKSR